MVGGEIVNENVARGGKKRGTEENAGEVVWGEIGAVYCFVILTEDFGDFGSGANAVVAVENLDHFVPFFVGFAELGQALTS